MPRSPKANGASIKKYSPNITLSLRIARFLEKRGLLERDAENTWLNLEEEEGDALTQLHGTSATYRIATGPQQGRKVFTLQTLPNRESRAELGMITKKFLQSLICLCHRISLDHFLLVKDSIF